MHFPDKAFERKLLIILTTLSVSISSNQCKKVSGLASNFLENAKNLRYVN